MVVSGIAVAQISAWSLSTNFHHRPLERRVQNNTRSASRKPALISLSVLTNLSTLITPLMPIKLINSVILRTRLTQINSNHLLGSRGMRTWLCVDATQNVIYGWRLIVRGSLSLLFSFTRSALTVLPF